MSPVGKLWIQHNFKRLAKTMHGYIESVGKRKGVKFFIDFGFEYSPGKVWIIKNN